MGMYPEGPKIPASIKKEQLLPPYKGVQNFIDEVSALPHGVQPIPVHIEPQDYDVLSTDCQGEYKLHKILDHNSQSKRSKDFKLQSIVSIM